MGEQEYIVKLAQLKAWMAARQFSRPDCRRIMNHFTANNQSSTYFDEKQILSFLPRGISRQISLEMYCHILGHSPLFRLLSKELLLKLCEAVIPVSVVRSQTVFQRGDIGHEMYYIVRGEVEVSAGPTNAKLGFIGHGGFFGEQTVIEAVTRKFGSGTCVRGRTVSATTDTDLAMLETEAILSICEVYPELEVRLRSFKRVGTTLGNKGQAAAHAKLVRRAVTKTNLDEFVDADETLTGEAQILQGEDGGDPAGTQNEWMAAAKRLLACSNGDLKLAITRLMGACVTSTPHLCSIGSWLHLTCS
jgi:CRP-like cAMP-binding protein